MVSDYDFDYVRDYMRERGIRSATGWTTPLVVREALTRGLEVTAKENGAALIRNGSRTHWFLNGNSSLNRQLARRCANLKEVTSRLLRSRGVRAPESTVFMPGDGVRAFNWAEPIFPVVVKPSNANRGRGVHVNISNWDSFESAFKVVERDFGEVLIEKQLFGAMHRVTVIDGKVVAALIQYPANVLGDGTNTIEKLVSIKNQDTGKVHKKIVVDSKALGELSAQGLSPASVPEPGRRVYLNRASNISAGGDAVDRTGSISEGVMDMLSRASRAIPGLRFAGYDVMLPQSPEDPPASILEVNPQPGIHAHHFPRIGSPRNVAASVLDAMFPETT